MRYPEIFLIRHGQTTWNRIGRHQGQLESVLTSYGIKQVHGIAKRLAQVIPKLPLVAFACSPLFRCQQTAVIICDELGVNIDNINYDKRLMERNFGNWQGLTDAQIIKRFPQEWEFRKVDPWSYSIPGGGENYNELSDRVLSWLREQKVNKPIIIVTHGQTGRALRGHLLGLSNKETLILPEPQNAAYHIKNGKAKYLEGVRPNSSRSK